MRMNRLALGIAVAVLGATAMLRAAEQATARVNSVKWEVAELTPSDLPRDMVGLNGQPTSTALWEWASAAKIVTGSDTQILQAITGTPAMTGAGQVALASAAGAAGWELVTAVPGRNGVYTFWFKRPVR